MRLPVSTRNNRRKCGGRELLFFYFLAAVAVVEGKSRWWARRDFAGEEQEEKASSGKASERHDPRKDGWNGEISNVSPSQRSQDEHLPRRALAKL